jgi:PAS domain S-box-containing protein
MDTKDHSPEKRPYILKELIDPDRLQRTIESFTQATGCTVAVRDYPELNVLVSTGPRELCRLFTLESPTNSSQLESLVEPEQLTIRAVDQGLIDCAVPIFVGDIRIAVLVVGQIFIKPPDRKWFQQQARTYGYDENACLNAMEEIPILSEATLKRMTALLGRIVTTLAKQGYDTLRMKEDMLRLESEVWDQRNAKIMFSTTLNSLPQSVFWKNKNGVYMGCNSIFARTIGLDCPEAVVGKTDFDLPWPPEEARAYRADDREVIEKARIKQHIVEPLQTADGRRLWIDITKIPLIDAKGKICGVLGVYDDITDRKKVEETPQSSQQWLTDIINFLPDATFAIDSKGIVIVWNKAAEEMTGVRAADILGKGNHEYGMAFYNERRPMIIDVALNPEARFDTLYAVIQREKDVIVAENYTPFLRGGAYLWGKASRLYDAEGKVVGAIESVRDITDRQKTEETLRNSQRRLADIVDFLPAATFAIDLEGKIILWNRAAEAFTGIKAQEVLGKDEYEHSVPFYGVRRPILVDLVLHPSEEIERLYPYVKREGDFITSESFTRNVKGGEAYMFGTAAPLYDADGKVIGAIEAIYDITNRKRAEEAQAALAREWQTTFDAVGYSIFLLDKDHRILRANKATETLFGKPLDGIIGHRCWEVVHGISEPFPECPVVRMRQSLKRETMELPVGDRWLEVVVDPILDNAGELIGVVHIVGDITDRKQTEAEIRNLNLELEKRVSERTAQLERANEELESFSYSISHDLRAPLRGIAGFSHILEEQYRDKLDDQGKDYLDRIQKGCRWMAQLIDDLLDLSRISRSEIRRQTVDLTGMANQILSDLQSNEPDRNVQWTIAEDLSVYADETLMRSVMENLLGNAWKFTRKKTDTQIVVGKIRQNETDVFFVQDNGAGFDMAYSKNLFTPFQRLHRKEEFEGTGIGLATVNRIISHHGGRIWAEGQVDKGAVFYFTIGKGK